MLKQETIKRFWLNVEGADNPAACWGWQGVKIPTGYGQLCVEGKMVGAHRLAYEILVGPIPEGLVIDHTCRNTGCVNPAHMEPVTNKENVLRGVGVTAENARKTHCSDGHELTPENTYTKPAVLILAIDPGPERSAVVIWDVEAQRVVEGGDQESNEGIAERLRNRPPEGCGVLVIERPVIMGKNATAALLETSRWAGVFEGSWPGIVARLTYHKVRCQLARSGNAKESEVKQALISRFAPAGYGPQGKGTKANPGPFYGVVGHMWSAVAVAVAWWDLSGNAQEATSRASA